MYNLNINDATWFNFFKEGEHFEDALKKFTIAFPHFMFSNTVQFKIIVIYYSKRIILFNVIDQ